MSSDRPGDSRSGEVMLADAQVISWLDQVAVWGYGLRDTPRPRVWSFCPP